MKKLWFLLLIPVLGGGAYLVYQNLPTKRYARHVVKARLFAGQGNLTAARLEYEKAYNITGEYTPYASLEVLQLTNRQALQEKDLAGALANTRQFVSLHPGNEDGLIQLAQLSLQAGDLETAFESIYSVLETKPDHFPARLLLTRVRTRQGRLDLAEEQLRYLAKRYPDSIQALLPLAENLLKQGKAAESREFLGDVLADHPDNSFARLLLVDTYLVQGETDSAKAVLDAWREDAPAELTRPLAVRRARFEALAGRHAVVDSLLAPYSEPRAENAAVLFELASMKAAQGEYHSALQIYKGLAEAVPTAKANCLRMSILLHLKMENPVRALEAVDILHLGNKNPELLLLTLAAAYQGFGMDRNTEELISRQPDSVQITLRQMARQWVHDRTYIGQWALVEYFRLHGQVNHILTATQALYKQWPHNSLAATLFAQQLAATRQYSLAAQVLEGIKQPTKAHRTTLLSMYARSGRTDKAVALANRMLKEDPRLEGLHLLLADHALANQMKDRAIQHYKKELAINPNSLVALNNLAWEYGVVQADYPKARPYLERLRNQKVIDPRILDTIGWILAKNGKGEQGADFVRQALHLVPDQPTFLFHMGWIHLHGGKKQEAKKYLQAALASKKPFQEREEAETLLARQR